jgi:hypothetical protein
MNLTVFVIVVASLFISGVLRVKYVPDSLKLSLLGYSVLAGLGLGLAIPPQFNAVVFLAAAVMGAVPVLARLTSVWMERRRVARVSMRVLGEDHG